MSIARIWATVKKKAILYIRNIYNPKDIKMIIYNKLWDTLKKKQISQYKLIKLYGFSSGQLDRLRKNDNVSTYTLNQLCEILNCELSDIAEYVSDKRKK